MHTTSLSLLGLLLVPSLVSLVLLYVFIWIGDKFPISLPDPFLGLPPAAAWVLILFVYTFIASRLPVWLLLQPRDYINSFQLYLGVIGLVIGLPCLVRTARRAAAGSTGGSCSLPVDTSHSRILWPDAVAICFPSDEKAGLT